MNAGRELDALVAEQVMGRGSQWEVQQQADGTFKPTGNVWWECPEYSTEIEDAWQVVERLRVLGIGVIVKAFPVGMQSAYSAAVPGTLVGAMADTAPLAICRTALAAVAALQPVP